MPYPYSYFKPTGKEQGAMAIGSLLAGLLSAAQPRQQGEASPALKGIAGATAGYGNSYKAYQDMMGDAFTRDLYDRKFGQDTNQFDQQMGLNRDQFGEEKRQFETSEKPYREAVGEYYKRDRGQPVDDNKIRDERVKRRLDIGLKKKALNAPSKMPDIGNYGKLKAQLAALKSTGNMDYIGMPENERASTIADLENAIRVMGQHQPELIPPQPQAQPVNTKLGKAAAQQFLNQAGGDKEKARELARQAGYEF